MMKGGPTDQQQQQSFNNGGDNNQSTTGRDEGAGTIDLKVILSKDEVAYLFGFDGVLIEQLRQQTGANVGITDGDSYEYVLCIGGNIEVIFKAFGLICRKLWDFLAGLQQHHHHQQQQQQLALRLAVPASQCGSIIGKQGSKVKEIRDLTGASIQVSQDSLPKSTERQVDIAGSGEACLQATYHICVIMQETPLRSELVPYIPERLGAGFGGAGCLDGWRPVFLCGDRAYVIDGKVARPAPPELLRQELAKTPLGGDLAESLARRAAEAVREGEMGGGDPSRPADHMNPLALMAAISKSQQNSKNGVPVNMTSKEVPVSVDLIVSALGDNLDRLVEIQRMSGAQVHVPPLPQSAAAAAAPDRRQQRRRQSVGGGGEEDSQITMTISGTEESILLAQFLIQSSIDMATKELTSSTDKTVGGGGGGGGENDYFQYQEPTNNSGDGDGGGGGGAGPGGKMLMKHNRHHHHHHHHVGGGQQQQQQRGSTVGGRTGRGSQRGGGGHGSGYGHGPGSGSGRRSPRGSGGSGFGGGGNGRRARR